MSQQTSSTKGLLKGRFRDGPFIGFDYRTSSRSATTDGDGTFLYQPGEIITFSIGTLTLGHAPGAESLTLADIHCEEQESGTLELTRSETINRARFVLSLGLQPDLHSGVLIDNAIRQAIEAEAAGIDFASDVDAFDRAAPVRAVFDRLGRRFRGAAEARNHVRRALLGIRAIRDVRVRVRDGSTLSADVFVPFKPGKYPVLLRISVYGRAFTIGSNHTQEDHEASEEREAAWWEDPKSREKINSYFRYSESAVSANASDWVPRGYVVVRVDARGIGQNSGSLEPFSLQEALDFYDAIQWAAEQPWSDGNVGIYGASYHGTIQWNVAALQPPALKAIAPLAPDADGYRDLAYPGGLFLEKYRRYWYDEIVGPARNPQAPRVDFVGGLANHPWDDDYYQGQGNGILSADFSKIHIPVFTSVSQTLWIHSRAGIEAFAQLPSPTKQLLIWDASYTSFMYNDSRPDLETFFDQHLKGKKPAQQPPPVRMVMRTGDGNFQWRDEQAWPVPGTEYRKFYLDATENTVIGKAGTTLPDKERSVEYTADADDFQTKNIPIGAYFETPPLQEDIELAGHFRANICVASSSVDADIWISIRVMDGEREVNYRTRDPGSKSPLTYGVLRASRRAKDPKLSTDERPWHTHKQKDEQLLLPDEIVEVDVELMPATGRIPKGRRLRFEITPVEGAGGYPGFERRYDESYHRGAINRVFTGGSYPTSVSIPVVPHR